jgi:hypothetical protein
LRSREAIWIVPNRALSALPALWSHFRGKKMMNFDLTEKEYDEIAYSIDKINRIPVNPVHLHFVAGTYRRLPNTLENPKYFLKIAQACDEAFTFIVGKQPLAYTLSLAIRVFALLKVLANSNTKFATRSFEEMAAMAAVMPLCRNETQGHYFHELNIRDYFKALYS